jgi:hypothetical protein
LEERKAMSHDSWNCLLVEEGPGILSDEVCLSLKIAACELHLGKVDKKLIDTGVCNGIIQTQWETRMVGAHSGVLFRAQVTDETVDGYKVNFLLNTEDLKTGAALLRKLKDGRDLPWTSGAGRLPCPELYEFRDLRAIRRRMLN